MSGAVRQQTTAGVRVMLHLRCEEADESGVARAYHEISESLAGTPGLLHNELLRDLTDPGAMAVLSEWRSLDAFRAWEEGNSHRGTTTPLRAYQDRSRPRPFSLYEISARY